MPAPTAPAQGVTPHWQGNLNTIQRPTLSPPGPTPCHDPHHNTGHACAQWVRLGETGTVVQLTTPVHHTKKTSSWRPHILVWHVGPIKMPAQPGSGPPFNLKFRSPSGHWWAGHQGGGAGGCDLGAHERGFWAAHSPPRGPSRTLRVYMAPGMWITWKQVRWTLQHRNNLERQRHRKKGGY